MRTLASLVVLSSVAIAEDRDLVPAPQSPIAVGPMAGRPAIADLNGDGDLDLVVACGTCCGSKPDAKSGHVVVLLGNGAGGFAVAPGSPIKIGSSVRKLAVGDLDEDGHPDVVAIEHDSYAVTVLRGDGTGRLSKTASVTAAQGPRAHTHEVAIADVDGDKHLDVLTTNANDRSVSILLGDGKGGLHPAPGSPIVVCRHPYDAIALQDVNGDDRIDLVVPDLKGNAVVVLLGNGKGGFAPAPGSPIAVGERPGYVAVVDANRDKKPDLVVTHDDVPMLDVLIGDGTGKFTAAGPPLRPPRPVWGIAVADLDGDTIPDLALGAMGKQGPVILLGDGKGGFPRCIEPPRASGEMPGYTAIGDLDDDGMQDVVTGNYASGDLSVYLARKRE